MAASNWHVGVSSVTHCLCSQSLADVQAALLASPVVVPGDHPPSLRGLLKGDQHRDEAGSIVPGAQGLADNRAECS
jgi:hypothetical protein